MDLKYYWLCSKQLTNLFSSNTSLVLIPLLNQLDIEQDSELLDAHINDSIFFISTEINDKSALDPHALPFVPKITDSCSSNNANISTNTSFKALQEINNKIQTIQAEISTKLIPVHEKLKQLDNNFQYNNQNAHRINEMTTKHTKKV